MDGSAPTGHNSKAAAVGDLLSYAQRIERLNDEKRLAAKEYGESIKAVWSEAKAKGYDGKALKEIIRIRAMDDETRAMIGFYADITDVFS